MLSGLRHRLATGGAVFVTSLILATPVAAQTASRSVVPIREVDTQPTGAPRYVVTVVVNGMSIETGLDTGSVGLRLLPRAWQRAGVAPQGASVQYSYGSGVELDGHGATAKVQVGGSSGSVTIQAVDTVGCTSGRYCPASRVSPADYGLMGSGRSRRGFAAIIGIRLTQGPVPSTLMALGVHRWIVHLPPRGRGQGSLVLNPDDHDLSGFVPVRVIEGSRGQVAGCAMIAAPRAERFCGPTLFDTGAPGLAIRGVERPPGWRPGLPATIAFSSTISAKDLVLTFRTGDRANGGATRFIPDAPRGRSLVAGTMPFYAFDVLFDGDRNTISLRPNSFGGSGSVRPLG